MRWERAMGLRLRSHHPMPQWGKPQLPFGWLRCWCPQNDDASPQPLDPSTSRPLDLSPARPPASRGSGRSSSRCHAGNCASFASRPSPWSLNWAKSATSIVDAGPCRTRSDSMAGPPRARPACRRQESLLDTGAGRWPWRERLLCAAWPSPSPSPLPEVRGSRLALPRFAA